MPTPAYKLAAGNVVLVEAGDMIPSDGEIIEGVASVNEAAITGEVGAGDPRGRRRPLGGHRRHHGGLRLASRCASPPSPGNTFLDRMIAMVEGAERRKTPNEMALTVLLAGLTLIFVIVVVTLLGLGKYSGVNLDPLVLGALFICLIPTTIGGLLSAIGIAGMDRLLKFNVLATSGRAVEAAGDFDTLLLDKTGTITHGNRMATEIIAAPGVRPEAAMQRRDDGLARRRDAGRPLDRRLGAGEGPDRRAAEGLQPVPFSATTRISGLDAGDRQLAQGRGRRRRQDAGTGQQLPAELSAAVDRIARSGGTPLAVAENGALVGVIHLKDVVKAGVKERFADLRRMGLAHGDDHRRQPGHRRGDRLRGRRRRLPRRGDARGQAAADPRGAGQGPAGGDVRRRLQRRAGAGAGRRGRRHADRHPGRPRGRQHGRPRFTTRPRSSRSSRSASRC